MPLSRVKEDRTAIALLTVALVAGLMVRFHFALTDDGIYWPDEIYQTLEPAHRVAFGYGLVAWEFEQGARNWALPGALAGLLGLCGALGLDARGYLALVKLLFASASGLSALGVVWLAQRHQARWLCAAAGGAALALMGLSVYFSPRAMGEAAAAPLLLLGWMLATGPASRRKAMLGAALVVAAVLCRLHCAVFAVGLLATLLAGRQWRRALDVFIVLAVGALVYGLLDWVTWGRLFHSARVYLAFNLVEGRAAEFGASPRTFYTGRLLVALGPLWALLVPLALLAVRRAPGLLLTTGLFFALHVAVPHKELRFIYPALVFICVLAAVGLEELFLLRWRWPGWLACAALVSAAALSLPLMYRYTFADLGVGFRPPQQSALDAGGPENRLYMAASEQRELCGLKVTTRALYETGGYTYLHRRVPLYGPGPDAAPDRYNYVIAAPGAFVGHEVTTDGPLALVRVREGCASDPDYRFRLE